MATRVKTTAAQQAIAQPVPIFQTFDSLQGLPLDTEGTFTIVASQSNFDEVATVNNSVIENIPSNPVVIFEGTYKGGQGYYNGAIFRNYSLCLYPNDYFGVQSRLIPDDTVPVTLTPAIVQAEEIRQKQLDYINLKLGKGIIDQPK